MALEHEVEVFELHRHEWADSHLGKFVVIQDDTVLDDFFDEWEQALRAGYAAFSFARPFLVRQVFHVDPVYFIGVAA